MLFLVYHHLGDSWKSAREASTSRLLCFTTGFPGAPKGSPLQLFSICSNAVHMSGVIDLQEVVASILLFFNRAPGLLRRNRHIAAFPDWRGAIQDRSGRVNSRADQDSPFHPVTQSGHLGSPRHVADGCDPVGKKKRKVDLAFHKVDMHVCKSW